MKCAYGCNNEANYTLKNGNPCCSRTHNSCPVNKKKNGEGVKKAYKNGNRKSAIQVYKDLDEDTKERMKWRKGKFDILHDELFIKNSKYSTSYVKNRIIQENLIEYKCTECGIIDKWNDKKIILELDHINGINTDNRVENLRFLCPNCHSQTEHFRGRNVNNGKIKVTDDELIDALQKNDNIRKALLEVGLSAKGANYNRCYKLLQNELE